MPNSRKSKFDFNHCAIRIACICLLAGLGLIATGCGKSVYYRWDLRHSKNIATPGKDWPGNPEKHLSHTQQEVYEARGTPDWVRFWWEGAFDNFSTNINPKFLSKKQVGEARVSWIYRIEGDEVIFISPFQSESVPLSPKLAVIIREGDPQERKFLPDPKGGEIELWTYFTSGMQYRFKGDELLNAKRVSEPMGSGVWLRG